MNNNWIKSLTQTYITEILKPKKPNVLLIGQTIWVKDHWGLKNSDLIPLKEIANIDLVLVDDTMTETELAEKCLGYEYLMLNMDFLSTYPEKMERLTHKFYNHPNIRGLKCINVDMTDADFFSPKLAKQKEIAIQTCTDAVTRSVAESAVTEILLHAKQRHLAYQDEISGQDVQCRKGINLFRKNAGIIGFGHIGKAVGEILSGMGMNIFYNDIDKMKPGKMISLEEMFKKCDVITIHIPALQKKSNISNIGMIDSKLLNLCKGTILINLATDIIVDADDLLKAIDSGKIIGYSVESGRKITNKLQRKKQIHYISPPCSWNSSESRKNVLNVWIQNMISAIQGTPINLWN
jgi:phosphoglycerate dehydrogenase-like enzyme